MNTHKRGDHLLATGLSKTLGDLASMIDAEVGQTSEGRALRDAVSRCTRYLTGGTFDAVIDKGKPVQSDDAHSKAFGEAVLALKLQMSSLVFALQFRRGIDEKDKAMRIRDLELANRQLATAKLATRLAVGQFFDQAIDEAVAARLTAQLRGEIQALRALLERIRETLCAAVERM